MTPEVQTVVFLHGIGAGPDSWNAQIDSLPEGFTGIAPRITGHTDAGNQEFSLASAAADVRDELDRRGIQRAHLCGLSLGGMVATRFAIDCPERVASLVLSGSQVHPNPVLMLVQNAIMRVLPARLVAPPWLSKQRMLTVLRTVGRTDFRAELAQVTAPTLRNVNLEIAEGELVLVIGPTGSGKSTLLGLLGGQVPHFTGGHLSGERGGC